jgi:hypothetical protein
MAAVQKIVNISVDGMSVALRVTPAAETGYVARPNDLHGEIDIE